MLKGLLAVGLITPMLSGCATTPSSGMAGAISAYVGTTPDLPEPEELERLLQGQFQSVRIYDRSGDHLLYEVIPPQGHRVYVPLDQIPIYLRQATIALEDKNFYTNPGVDLQGVGRAFLYNLRGEGVQGASTITMQLVRNALFAPEERYEITYARKAKEAQLALALTERYPGQEGKDRILEWYLNICFYGQLAYGVEAASQLYFGKHVQELNLAEAAMLAPLPQNPSLTPIDNFAAAKERQGVALEAMVRAGYLTEEEAAAAGQVEITIVPPEERFHKMQAPHFALYVHDLLQRQYGEDFFRLGLRVRTTLDLDIQNTVQGITAAKIADYGVKNNANNAAAVVLRPETGELLAMVGSVDYENEEIDGQVNMALAPRQPGSSFKPYTYLAAFEQGYTAATVVMDAPITFTDEFGNAYSPENIDKRYHGAVTLRQALGCSYNVPAVRLLDMLGIEKAAAMARRLGITTLEDGHYGLSLTLGAKEVRLLDHAFAYSVFANGGTMRGQPVPEEERRPGLAELMPVSILSVTDSRGQILQEYSQPERREVVAPQYVFILNSVLSDPEARKPAFGASAQYLVLADRPVATKTGSTNENHDAWTMGYTPQYVVGVWVGNADQSEMSELLGSTGAGPIYHEIMKTLHEGLPAIPFQRPPDIVEAKVCTLSGLLPGEHCIRVVDEFFVKGTEPTETCPLQQHVYEYIPELEGGETPRAEVDGNAEIIAISYPSAGAALSGTVGITGTATSPNLWYHKVEFSLDGNNWTTTESDYMKTSAVVGGVLATWDTTLMANGSYWLRAVLVDKTGNYITTESIPVTVSN